MAEIWQYIKQQWARYKAWQIDPTSGMQPADRMVTHHCANCGREFTGRYCSECSQRAGSGRITWDSIRQGVMELWGLGTRSLPYTLWQLVWRPGYLIGDYIMGRRQMSFPPIKMLVFVAVFVILLSDWSGLSAHLIELETPADADAPKDKLLEVLTESFVWGMHHYDWFMLFLMSLFIIPTHFIFRHSPRCPRHTLHEGFFIQVFNATMMLLFLVALFSVFDFLPEDLWNDLSVFLPLILLWRNYHQLFGYGWWGTTWRMILLFVAVVAIFMAIIHIVYYYILASDGLWAKAANRMVTRTVPLTLCIIGSLYAVYRFDRYKARRAATNEHNE